MTKGPSAGPNDRLYAFGPFVADPVKDILERNGSPVVLASAVVLGLKRDFTMISERFIGLAKTWLEGGAYSMAGELCRCAIISF
jgi:hypothetical protein